MRNGVKHPALFSGVHVERSDVAGRTGQRFRYGAGQNDHVLKDHSRAAGADAHRFGIPVKALSEIDAAIVAKLLDGPPGKLVESIQEIAISEKDAVLIQCHAAMPVATS